MRRASPARRAPHHQAMAVGAGVPGGGGDALQARGGTDFFIRWDSTSLSHDQSPSETQSRGVSRDKGGDSQPSPWEAGPWEGWWDGLGHLLLGLGWCTEGKVPEEIYSAALLRADHPSQGCVCKSSGLLIGLSG